MNTTFLQVMALAVSLGLAGCGTSIRATSDADPTADLASVETFSWIDPNPLIRSVTQLPLNPLIEQRLMDDTQEILAAQGLRFVSDPTTADVVVAFTIGSREGIRISSYPTRSFSRGPRGSPSFGWGGYWPGNSVQARQYTEGQLAVDIFDVASRRPVWHGTATSRITRRDRETPDELVRAVLERILADFPAGR